MIRTQIQLSEQDLRRLKKLARQAGVSLAEMVRRCVSRFLEAADEPARSDLYARAAGLVGAFKDRVGTKDVSTHHDRYLEQDFR